MSEALVQGYMKLSRATPVPKRTRTRIPVPYFDTPESTIFKLSNSFVKLAQQAALAPQGQRGPPSRLHLHSAANQGGPEGGNYLQLSYQLDDALTHAWNLFPE